MSAFFTPAWGSAFRVLSSLTTKTGLATGCSLPVRGEVLTGAGIGAGIGAGLVDAAAVGEVLGEGEAVEV